MIDPIRSVAQDSSTAIEFYGGISPLNTATPAQNVQSVDDAPVVRPVTPVATVSRQTPNGRQLGHVIDTYA
ncbi:MAG: hypothetical protein M3126_05075 [Candidatus Eremiobacteraeota bacterium]|nr:hypothetical protein [Candidatus Eremiobacteraeota bacterium]